MNSADCHSSVVEPPSVSPLPTPELKTLPIFGDAPPIDSLTGLRNLTRSAPEQIPRSSITLNHVISTLILPTISIDGEQHPVDIEAPLAALSIIDIACLARTLLFPSPDILSSETRTLVSSTATIEEEEQQQQPVDVGTLTAKKAPEASTVTVIGLPTPNSMPHHAAAAAAPVFTGSPSQITPSAPASLMSISFDVESPPTAFPAPPSTSSEGSDEGPGSPMSISTPASDLDTSVDTNQLLSEPVSSPLSDRSTTPDPPEECYLGIFSLLLK